MKFCSGRSRLDPAIHAAEEANRLVVAEGIPSVKLTTAGLRWRLFDFGRVDAEVAEANSANSQALLAYRQTVLRATEDVENAFMSLAQLELQTREPATEVDALARARDASQQSYLAGTSSLTDVSDAERQSLVAQDQLAQTRADTDRAAVMSFRALGGGWKM